MEHSPCDSSSLGSSGRPTRQQATCCAQPLDSGPQPWLPRAIVVHNAPMLDISLVSDCVLGIFILRICTTKIRPGRPGAFPRLEVLEVNRQWPRFLLVVSLHLSFSLSFSPSGT